MFLTLCFVSGVLCCQSFIKILFKLYLDLNHLIINRVAIMCKKSICRGGGVLLAVQDNIISKILPSPTNIEMLCVKAELPQSTIICIVYLP